MNAVHGSIIENLKSIEIIYDETVPAFKSDRTNTADSKEVSVSEFVASYLSADYQVKSQSKIYSRTQETNNIDCLILSPNHPRLITPKREVVLAEGVYAAIEVKPDISTLTDKSEFFRAMEQMRSVKNIVRTVEKIEWGNFPGEENIPEYYDKIPAVIFSSKCSNLDKTIQFMIKKIKNEEFTYEEVPDLVISLDKGIIFYSPVFQSTSIGKSFAKQHGTSPTRAFVSYESKDRSHILVMFLRFLLNFMSPHLLLMGFIVNNYLNDIPTNFNIRVYDVDKIKL